MSQEEERRMGRSYSPGADETPSEAIYSAVADGENCSPLDLTPLATVTDPDALDDVLTADPGVSRVVFQYSGYEVTATASEISLEKSDGEDLDGDATPS